MLKYYQRRHDYQKENIVKSREALNTITNILIEDFIPPMPLIQKYGMEIYSLEKLLLDYEDTNTPENIIDDNLCPRCKCSVQLLYQEYCQVCGKSIITKYNAKKGQYKYVEKTSR